MTAPENPKGAERVVLVHASRLAPAFSEQDWALLSSEERDRANAFKFDRHRRLYVAAHAKLRKQLGGHSGSAPEELRFQIGAFGKPQPMALRTASLPVQ